MYRNLTKLTSNRFIRATPTRSKFDRDICMGTFNSCKRQYWGFTKPDDEQNSNNNKSNDSNSGSNGEGGGGLISPYGDNSPYINPLIILPTIHRPVIPGFISTIAVTDGTVAEEILKRLKEDMHKNSFVGVFLRKRESIVDALYQENDKVNYNDVVANINQVYNTGTFVQIQQTLNFHNELQLIVMGHRRITLNSIDNVGPPSIGHVKHWPAPRRVSESQHSSVKAYTNEILSMARELMKMNPLLKDQIFQYYNKIDFNNPYKLADFATMLTTADGAELQRVLECEDIEQRLSIVLELLTKERELSKIQKEISKQVEEKVNKQQREFYLREQLKSIKKELGMEKDDKEDLMSKYQTKLQALLEEQKKRSSLGQSNAVISTEALKTIKDELQKLQGLEKNSPEFNVTRSYLDWLLLNLPWHQFTEDKLNLSTARTILDNDHYGLEQVKRRILEFIAVGKLTNGVAGKIICLVGPPGVGKTSVAKSIAHALEKKFYRFSVGGLSDAAEIKGHRRTYIGAMPGKPIQCLKATQTMNPLVLIDEIDKLAAHGRGHGGDPSSALLELLDPNQNSSFIDHYLDVPVDFSNVLFVCTANDESLIPGPLRDRMEMIRLSGYDLQEKVHIAEKYLIPKALRESGLMNSNNTTESNIEYKYELDRAALDILIRSYCRESGVRSLEKSIEKIARKLAYSHVLINEDANHAEVDSKITGITDIVKNSHNEGNVKVVRITAGDIEKFLGKPIFPDETIYENNDANINNLDEQEDVNTHTIHHTKNNKYITSNTFPIGIVMGLAWNPLGGSPIFIETVALPVHNDPKTSNNSDKDNNNNNNSKYIGITQVTGQLGDVMRESVNIANTFARKFLSTIDKPSDSNTAGNYADFYRTHEVHLHVPDGATGKDGPSAGVAMCCALVSQALRKPLRAKTAMTGELSLTGKVLPVGGIKEKTLAAKRAGAKTIIMPFANRRDFDELPDYVKEGLEVHFVKEFQQVYDIVFA